MKIAILGIGAMGSVYAGLLADAGLDVWGVDTWKEHVDAIRANGLRVSGASGDRVARLNATTNADDVGKADLVIIATKASGVVAARLAMIRMAIAPSSCCSALARICCTVSVNIVVASRPR